MVILGTVSRHYGTDDMAVDYWYVPGVVSITRALGATGFASAVTGPFDIRIILTEEPVEFTAAHIVVEDENGAASGTASAPVAGSPIEDGRSDCSLCWRRLC